MDDMLLFHRNKKELKKIKNEITRREADFKILYSKKVEEIISEDEFVREYNLYKKTLALEKYIVYTNPCCGIDSCEA